MNINKEYCNKVIDQLETWKTHILDEEGLEHYKKYGILETRDYLDGIRKGNDHNYAKTLFSNLNEAEKHYILLNIDFMVNFDQLYCEYYLGQLFQN